MTFRDLIEKELGKDAETYNEPADKWVRVADYNALLLKDNIRRKPAPTVRPFATPEEALPYVGRLVVHTAPTGEVKTSALHVDATCPTHFVQIATLHYTPEEAHAEWTWLDGPEKGQPVGITEEAE